MLFELIDHVIGERVTLILGQRLLEATHDLAAPAESESNAVSEDVAPGHWGMRTE